MRDLSAHLRHLFVVQTLGHVPDSFSVTADQTDRLAVQADRLSQAEILRAIDFLAAAIAAVKDGSEPRIQLEMALLKATAPGRPLAAGADVPDRPAGGGARCAPGHPSAPAPSSASTTPRRRAAGQGASPPSRLSRAVGSIELGQIVSLWPAVAGPSARRTGCSVLHCPPRPHRPRRSRSHCHRIPSDAAFVKKAEQGREIVTGAVGG